MSYFANIDMHDIADRLYAIEPTEWREQIEGYNIFICRGPMKAYCGYVSIPVYHPFHGRHYDEIDVDVHVHGGLTYCGNIENCDGFYVGFDCSHYMDFYPSGPHLLFQDNGIYRCFDYVRTECLKLLFQLKWYEKEDK